MANTDTLTFHLGITMAGAVSAGAYTARFMDYLLEALERWEEKKAHNREVGKGGQGYAPTVPMHDVVIDVLGGGGHGGYDYSPFYLCQDAPVHSPSDIPTGNILYDSWVLLDDDVDGTLPNPEMTFEKMYGCGVLYKDYFRMLVFPLKRKPNGDLEDHPSLASSLLGGFGGFLDREFRKHDFFLGRANARNFLRGLFMLEYDAADPHPLFKGVAPETLEAYARTPRENNLEWKRYLPLVTFLGDK